MPAMILTAIQDFGSALWFDVANITGAVFDDKVTFSLGRMELDTPFIFTETWTIANNTFDTVSVTVNTIEKLTLVADYIYDGNGNGKRLTTMGGGFTGSDGYFPFLGSSDGALAIGTISTLDKITSQAWYFNISDKVKAFWLQADADYNSFTIGAQYAMSLTLGTRTIHFSFISLMYSNKSQKLKSLRLFIGI